MKVLARALARAVSSPWPPKRPALSSSLAIFEQSSPSSSVPYSTTYTTSTPPLRQRTYRKQKPQESPPATLSSLTVASRLSQKNRRLQEKENPSEIDPPAEARVSSNEVEKAIGARAPAGDWPRPSEIPWQAKVANSVSLIGTVAAPVQFGTGSDGKHYAGTVILQDPSPDTPSLRIPITFEGDLAHVAACHLKENECIFIAGQLSADASVFAAGSGQNDMQVMVGTVNFVQQSFHIKDFSPPVQKQLAPSNSGGSKKDKESTWSSWRDLIENPNQWSDYRTKKQRGLVNPKHPDFKSKDGKALWLNNKTPVWVLSGLEGLDFDVQSGKAQVNKTKSEDLWKSLLENANKWWDNRSNKLNEKAPDFKHKETGEVLWLNDSPQWVKPRLPPVKTKPKAGCVKA